MRMSVLHLSPDLDLPLHYEYDTSERRFRTLGYVRAGGIMTGRSRVGWVDSVLPHVRHR